MKLPKNKNHDPHNKQVGECPFSNECTDATGEHHSGLVTEQELKELRNTEVHITRTEVINLVLG